MNKVLVGVGIASGIIAGGALIPVALGFGSAGIVGGSVAAGIQSGIGNVVAGSLFSVCQSLGMTGFFTALSAKVATVGTIAAGTFGLRKIFNR